MRQMWIVALLALSIPAYSQTHTPELDKILTNAAQSLAAMPFDASSPVTMRGRVSTLVWPQGTSGMVVMETDQSGHRYAFLTARVPDMAKQGFTRFSIQPGEEVTVTGVLTTNKATIGPGFTAARADLITKARWL